LLTPWISSVLQAHLKAARANATTKLLKELAKTSSINHEVKNSSHHDNFKTLAITEKAWFIK